MNQKQLIQELIYSLPTNEILHVANTVYTIIDDKVIILKNRYSLLDGEQTKYSDDVLKRSTDLRLFNLNLNYNALYTLRQKCRGKTIFIDVGAFGKRGQDAIEEFQGKNELKVIGSLSAEGKSKLVIDSISDKEKQIKEKIEGNAELIKTAESLVKRLKKENQDLNCELGALNKTKKVFGG